jgi:4-amino-4-deoxy-L-arabinose transferase-like glycosyltransferase
VAAAVFSLSKGIFHPYYSVQLAPAVAALAGTGSVALWHVGRRHRAAGWVLPATIVATAAVAVEILDRTPTYAPRLGGAIAVGAALAAGGLLAATYLRQWRLLTVAAVLAGGSLLAAPAAFAVTTANSAVSGSIPVAGPSGGGGGFGRGGGTTTDTTALVTYLEAHRGGAQYLVAGFGSQSTAPIIIASGQPVITIGGFNGGDPAPTLAEFEAMVAHGKVRYVLVSGGGGGGFGGGGPGGGGGSAINSWVTAHGTQVDYGGAATLYLVTN